MARSRRGGGGGGGGGGLFGAKRKPAPPAPARRAAPAARSAPPAARSATPATTQSAPPAKSGGMLSGIGSTIAQGMAFGTGSAIAHQAVGAAVGAFSGGSESEATEQQAAPVETRAQYNQQQAQSGSCSNDKEMFFDCLKQNQGDQQSCSFLYDQLQSCQRNETTFG
mmetsp:Transcript_4295/g.9733  ORF Transcript_4295/g.9733 Transcript_4295/m.9733 type:complete len:167 (-) Transcript_4295:249-749(-)|eukprot:CAMPEP_0172300392 /NCGR_PEP_ID=MMETSP1058-20130122/2491_1 /TAXON_ID=83371 /ORGANISM="Detonula confervacea, Strain CCMP 353" /LENGTH=166 /DNA_ID=CAMNT_0013010157 /DNA_START=77 /DNA_END=577 /DNA_ORIENTATION=+